jgi:hypothetical protein
MNAVVNKATGDRIAVLSPVDRTRGKELYAEWERVLDSAPDDPRAQERAKVQADELWLQIMRMQWTFEGWLAEDLKTVLGLDGAPRYLAEPGDMHVEQRDLKKWGKP